MPGPQFLPVPGALPAGRAVGQKPGRWIILGPLAALKSATGLAAALPRSAGCRPKHPKLQKKQSAHDRERNQQILYAVCITEKWFWLCLIGSTNCCAEGNAPPNPKRNYGFIVHSATGLIAGFEIARIGDPWPTSQKSWWKEDYTTNCPLARKIWSAELVSHPATGPRL
jgi:hypothetical protein